VEAMPHNCIPHVQIGLSIALYMRILLFVESSDFCPSIQYILVSIIPTCFCFVNMCLRQVSLMLRCNLRYLTSSWWGRCTLFIGNGGQVSLHVVYVTWTSLYTLAYILHFFTHFLIVW
jgi:hypothetical protein